MAGLYTSNSAGTSYSSPSPSGSEHSTNATDLIRLASTATADGDDSTTKPSSLAKVPLDFRGRRNTRAIGGRRRRHGDDSGSEDDMKRAKRLATNSRERWRQQNVNEAFQELRKMVPTYPPDKKLSKHEILRMATRYISFLQQLLNDQLHEQNRKAGFTGQFVAAAAAAAAAAANGGGGGGGGGGNGQSTFSTYPSEYVEMNLPPVLQQPFQMTSTSSSSSSSLVPPPPPPLPQAVPSLPPPSQPTMASHGYLEPVMQMPFAPTPPTPDKPTLPPNRVVTSVQQQQQQQQQQPCASPLSAAVPSVYQPPRPDYSPCSMLGAGGTTTTMTTTGGRVLTHPPATSADVTPSYDAVRAHQQHQQHQQQQAFLFTPEHLMSLEEKSVPFCSTKGPSTVTWKPQTTVTASQLPMLPSGAAVTHPQIDFSRAIDVSMHQNSYASLAQTLA
ncbi:uncharacterized protein [Oscarella lobularis]|uniref:uncharacterized protein n=1 Tax=Oscarella lobularis TaxID=121494 RepID=UPI0033131501